MSDTVTHICRTCHGEIIFNTGASIRIVNFTHFDLEVERNRRGLIVTGLSVFCNCGAPYFFDFERVKRAPFKKALPVQQFGAMLA